MCEFDPRCSGPDDLVSTAYEQIAAGRWSVTGVFGDGLHLADFRSGGRSRSWPASLRENPASSIDARRILTYVRHIKRRYACPTSQ